LYALINQTSGFACAFSETDKCAAATLEGRTPSKHNCLVFLPEHIVSASHDKILIWDLKQREVLKTIQRDDQFWVMAKHPETNQVAAGHDSGVIIIKAKRETCLCC
jgi:hypothetical protein